MRAVLTLDASVFTSSCNPHEKGCEDSRALLDEIRKRGYLMIEPMLLPVEVAAALSRGRGDESLAREYAEALAELSHMMLVPVDHELARQAAKIAARYRLRGADAIYVATAFRAGSTLVTLDKEQQNRVPKAVHACTPSEALRDKSLFP